MIQDTFFTLLGSGLIAAGLEHCPDASKELLRPFLMNVISLEKRNKAMNAFIVDYLGMPVSSLSSRRTPGGDSPASLPMEPE